MTYKALMLDVDGTIVPYTPYALPSDAVVNAIQKAREKVTVCLVTGRGYGFVKPVLKRLKMHSGYVIVNNGANVFDLTTDKLIYDQPIDFKTAKTLINLLQKENILFYLKHTLYGVTHFKGHYTEGQKFRKVYMIYTDEIFNRSDAEKIINKLKKFPDITLYMTYHKGYDKFGIHISHVKATKLHGIYEVAKRLNIKHEEIIGVGDSYNDFPLLMASGLKVAMGNAIDELKDIADYIAPGVEEDGVVDVIKKFII